ncbi:EthD family reductase [Hydrogenophaga sp.]|uniref:EthD domain-containing protein n=1 Tax=Hydrogenophaga sp. TaxID=1904254 RepID=UPI002610B47E|nr:EthD family reductase [Hydrogenophaga sp.]MCW5652830.1 EthD family reductase [Hydrogenophaga sp.]
MMNPTTETVRMGLLQRNPALGEDAFRAYWRDHHGPLAAQAPGLRAYWQNPVLDRLQRGIDFARGPWDFDGFSQLWFDSAADAGQAFDAGNLAGPLREDEARFLAGLHIVTCEQTTVIELPAPAERARRLKRMSILKRRPDIDEADFRREWRVHAGHVRRMPGVSGYRQNVVVARERRKGEPCGYEALPIDGIVELWFTDPETLNAAFASPAGQVTMAHAKDFLHEITAFVVQEHRVA